MAEMKNLTLDISDGVARLILNRPKHNVLNIEMMKAFNAVIEELIADKESKCLVIGDRANVDGAAARRAGMHFFLIR